MLLERRTVSRKTPGDGKLEISALTADAVTPIGPTLTVELSGRHAPASVSAMTCTCAKGAGSAHRHLFLESDLLKELEAGAEVDLRLDRGAARLSVTPVR
jgi:hypothetical protein